MISLRHTTHYNTSPVRISGATINTLIHVFIPNSERRQHVGRTMLGDTVHPRLSEPRLSEHQTWSQAEHNSIHFSEDIN